MPTKKLLTALLTISSLGVLAAFIAVGDRHTPAGEILVVAGSVSIIYLISRGQAWVERFKKYRRFRDIPTLVLCLVLIGIAGAHGRWVITLFACVLLALTLAPENLRSRVLARPRRSCGR